MKKPKPRKREPILHYDECAKYIAHKLGIKDLHNVAGWEPGQKDGESPPYLNWWHFICDQAHNGSEIYLPFTGEGEAWPPKDMWAYKIAKAFNDEFGEESVYWVEW